MQWTDEAKKELQKVPGFVRKMAKRAVEAEAAKNGLTEITLNDVKKARSKYIAFAEDDDKDTSRTRIAVVRCETVSEVCPGVACFKAFNTRRQQFKDYDAQTEIIGFFTCGGCPGRRISRLVESLKKHKVDVVHLSSCMLLEEEYPKCPHINEIINTITGKGIKVVKGTHH